jgi:hypothetical protein
MSKKSLMEAIESDGLSGLISGAVAVLGSSMLFGLPITESIPVFGNNIPIGLVIGGTVALSVSTSKFIHDELLERIPALNSVDNIIGRFAPPIVAGASTYLIFRLGISSDTSIMNSVLLGSISAVTGDYITESFIKTM